MLFVISFIFILSNNTVSACTGITASQGDTVLFGNNEDWSDPNTYVWVTKSRPGKFGGIYFGYGNFYPQGGMNEKGLCFDGFATVNNPVHNPANKPLYQGNFIEKVMEECQNVAEVIELFNSYYLPWILRTFPVGDNFFLQNNRPKYVPS